MSTLAMAAMFAVVLVWPGSADAAGKASGVQACDLKVMAVDPDANGSNVRSGPGTRHRVVGNLRGADWVHVTGSQEGWMRISRATADDEATDTETVVFEGEGWVHGSLLGVDGVGGEAGGTALHAQPDRASPVVVRMAPDDGGGRLRDCRGAWLQVDHRAGSGNGNAVRGWAHRDEVCIATRTLCN